MPRAALACLVAALAAVASSCGTSGGTAGDPEVCRTIDRTFTLVGHVKAIRDLKTPADVRRVVNEVESAFRRLDRVAPDGIDDDTHALATAYTAYARRLAAAHYDLWHLSRDERADLYFALDDVEGDDDGENIGDYAEERCGYIAAHDISDGEAITFCLAYQHYADLTGGGYWTTESTPQGARKLVRPFREVVATAPPVVAREARRAEAGLRAAAAGRATAADRAETAAALGAVRDLADRACTIDT